MSPSAAALNQLIVACRAGAGKYTQTPAKDLFNIRLDRLISKQFSARDRECLRLIQAEGSSGLLAARRRSMKIAQSHFTAGQKVLSECKMTPRARKLAESILFPQKAYELYVRGQFSNAAKFLRQSFVSDLALEADTAYSLLAMHRIQLLNNLMRVEFAPRPLAARDRARRQAAAIFAGARCKDLSSVAVAMESRLESAARKIPAGLVANMHAQIAAETVSLFQDALAAVPPSQIKAAMSYATRLVSAETQIGRWVDFQLARFGKPVDACCFAASAVLRHGSVPSAPLWLSVAQYMQTALATADTGG